MQLDHSTRQGIDLLLTPLISQGQSLRRQYDLCVWLGQEESKP